MTAAADINPGSFFSYEGIRIVVPGTIAVTLYAAVDATYGLRLASPASSVVGGVVAALLIGLILRFVDVPAGAAPYKSRDLPHRELTKWNLDPVEYRTVTNVYFVLLDTAFPGTVRDRSLYVGSLFRIATEGIYMVAFTSLGVLVLAAVAPTVGAPRTSHVHVILILFTAGSLQLLSLAFAFRTDFRFRRNRFGRRTAATEVMKRTGRDLGLTGICALVVALATTPLALAYRWREGIVVAAAIPAVAWGRLYLRGRGEADGTRRPISPMAGVTIYGVAAAVACVSAAVRGDRAHALNATTALAWGAATLLPSLMLASRGHERSLIANFRTQTTWMRINRERLIAEQRLKVVDPETLAE